MAGVRNLSLMPLSRAWPTGIADYFVKAGMFKVLPTIKFLIMIGMGWIADYVSKESGYWIVATVFFALIAFWGLLVLYKNFKIWSLSETIAILDYDLALNKIGTEEHGVPCKIAMDGLFDRVYSRTNWGEEA